ncbi:hypothetical protein AGOR_G00189590 [Albula goreensis]|uniref:GB1/RHD3-type G domain-containing protein n=1 Tax=Albula goreensis TaxID=1534307 RepID=A0A8T3CQB7_9TELE|nr:hypothetical protein AGOR_G00189590 [Albula goreensis]
MQKPVCLIDSESTGELQVNQEALNILSSIRQPVVVVSIVGMYRTGKSYLMNRLAGKQTGFTLGSTIQSETKGIWMWCVPHPYKKNHTLVLLDTEGLGDVEKGDQAHDTWIFALAVLLSSTFVYNSMGTINNEALMSLHYVTELTENIKVKSSLEKEEETASNFTRFFPTFVWAVRDFTLELKIGGQQVTADDYLENSLKLMKVLGNLAAAYVEAIRNGSVPCLENAVLALSQIENSTAVEQSLALYRQLLGERVKLHTETQEELSRVHEGCLKEALEFFMKRSFKDENQVYQKDLMERIKDEYDGKCSENAVQSQTHCAALLQQLWSKLDHESFMRPGGYTDYRVQMDSIIQTYKGTPGKGVQADQALEIFVKEKSDLGASILSADKNLTEQERRVKEEEARAEMERFKAEVAKREQEDTMKRLEDTEKAHRENERQLMERMERERKAALEENQRVLDQRLKEQKALMEEGFESRAREMESQIHILRQEVEASRNSGGGGGCVLL